METHLEARASTLALECFGARLMVCSGDRRILDDLKRMLPPGSRTIKAANVDATFFIQRNSKRRLYSLKPSYGSKRERAYRTLEELSSEFHFAVAMFARPYLFVHAGVVAWQGQAVVLPGRSMTGKSTLVSRLVERGATYYSDEYAVLDGDGQIHPYRKSLALRTLGKATPTYNSMPVRSANRHNGPVKVGVLAFLKYKSQSRWSPQGLTPAEAVLGLFKNTVAARDRAEFALRTLSRAVRGAISIKGVRPDASIAAPALINFASEHSLTTQPNAEHKHHSGRS